MAAALSSRATLRAAPVVRGAKASKAAATTRPTRSLATRAAIADLPKENKDTKVLVVGGTALLLGGSLVQLLASDAPLAARLAVPAIVAGLAILLATRLRDRLRPRPHDPYTEVKR